MRRLYSRGEISLRQGEQPSSVQAMSSYERLRAGVALRRHQLQIALTALVVLAVATPIAFYLLRPLPLRATTLAFNVKAAQRLPDPPPPASDSTSPGAAPAPGNEGPPSSPLAAPGLSPARLTPVPGAPEVAPGVTGPPPRLHSARGRVLDAARKPIAGASVVAN